MVYVIGNSHSHVFTASTPSKFGEGENRNEYFRSFSLGPTIAYNFYDHHLPLMIEWVNQLPINNMDYILLAIGEVDCRFHIPFQASKQNRDVIEMTHECVARFFQTHLFFKEHNYNVIGWGGHPSTTGKHNDNPSEPVFGDCLFRNKISLAWNDYLEQKCKTNNIPFASIFKKLLHPTGLTEMSHFNDYCHLNPNKVLPIIIDEFKQKQLI